MQALMAFVAVGFMFGSLIVRPFLPQKKEDSSICGSLDGQTFSNFSLSDKVNGAETIFDLEQVENVPSIVWPFLIIASFHIFTGLAIIVLGWYILFLLILNLISL
jgi:hypothetical protein